MAKCIRHVKWSKPNDAGAIHSTPSPPLGKSPQPRQSPLPCLASCHQEGLLCVRLSFLIAMSLLLPSFKHRCLVITPPPPPPTPTHPPPHTPPLQAQSHPPLFLMTTRQFFLQPQVPQVLGGMTWWNHLRCHPPISLLIYR